MQYVLAVTSSIGMEHGSVLGAGELLPTLGMAGLGWAVSRCMFANSLMPEHLLFSVLHKPALPSGASSVAKSEAISLAPATGHYELRIHKCVYGAFCHSQMSCVFELSLDVPVSLETWKSVSCDPSGLRKAQIRRTQSVWDAINAFSYPCTHGCVWFGCEGV